MYDAGRGGWGIGRYDGSGEYYIWDSEENTRVPWSEGSKNSKRAKKVMDKEEKNVYKNFIKLVKEDVTAARHFKRHRTLRQFRYDWSHPWERHRSLPDVVAALRDSDQFVIWADQWHEHVDNAKSAAQKFLLRCMRRSV